ncbi:MAG TPA: cbb3-type cytochrome c oxidase subunit I [Gaiellaceae bacterium]|nr:cbb3-type cytochrome c oxidase subunit I [Gaiellaceae bacterium]
MSVVALPRRASLLEWIGSTDHKRVGVRVATYSFTFFLAAGVFALLMRTELAQPGLQVMSRDTYDQLFTMHGSAMIFLVMTPLALALGVYFVPLQIGATQIAWPRLALVGDWLIPISGATMFAGFATDHGAAKDGWTAFAPLSDVNRSPGYGMDLWIVGAFLATAGAIVLGACVLASVIRLRAPGMTMLRLPVFTWSMIVTCLLVVAAFPALLVALSLLFVDRHFDGAIFAGAGGATAYQHLFWFYGHPVVYVIFFPFVGAVGEVVAVFSRRRFFGYHALVLSLLVFAALSMSVWAHHMFATGRVTNQYFSLTSTLLAVPAGVEYFDLVGTMIGGSILLSTSMLFAIGFILLFLVGGLTGIIVASPPLDYHVHDTFFVVGHFHYTIFAGSLFGFFAAVYYWYPKVTGRLLREGLGKLHFALYFVGANLTFFPMFISGWEGMPRRVADYQNIHDLSLLNLLSTIGGFMLALGTLVFLWNLWISSRRPLPAGSDPWEGHTLEWWTTSPPPLHNFDSLPPVRSYSPLYDRRLGET